jgi:hypothetical protein
MDDVVRAGQRDLRATASGRDIYAISVPIVVETLERLLTNDNVDCNGARALGDIFDARSFLESLARAGMRVE